MAQIIYTAIGQYRHTIDLLDPGGSQRNTDGTSPDPTVFASNLPAAIQPLTYTSTIESKTPHQVLPEVTHRVIIRSMSGVLSRMTVIFHPRGDTTINREMTIMRIKDPDEMGVEMHLICSERNDGR